MTRYEAYVQLLALPDEPAMPARSHSYTRMRHFWQNPDVLKRDLGIAFTEWRRQEHLDISSFRIKPVLQQTLHGPVSLEELYARR